MTYSQNDLSALELELKKNPSDSACYVKLAEAQLALNKKEQAFSTYRAAKVICPDDVSIMLIGSKVFEAIDKREEAIDCLQKALQTADIKIYNAENISHLAELLYNAGKKDLALSWLNKLVKSSSENPDVLMKLAQIHLSLGNISESQKYLKTFKEKFGATREMYNLMGETMFARGFFDGAVKNYSDAVKTFKEDSDMHLGLGKAWLGMGEKETALKELKEALRLKPDDINILLELGKLQSSIGLADEANDTFSKIENSKLQNGECLLGIALHFIARKNDIRALHFLELARSLSPYHLDIMKTLGETTLRMRRYEQALEVFSSAVKIDKKLVWAYEGIVTSASHINHFEEKAEAQKNLLYLKNSSAEDWCDYAETLIKLGLFEESQEAFEKASKLDHTCLRAYEAPEIIKLEKARAEGEKFAKKGEEALEKRFFMSATDNMEKALNLVPNNPAWAKILAKIALKTANIEKASSMLSIVRDSEPENLEIGYELARTYEFSNNLQMAIELLTALTKDYPLEFKAHLMLLRLKRCLVRGNRISIDMLNSIIKNIDSDLGDFRRESHIPTTVKGFAYYIFSYRSSFEVEALRKAEGCFTDVLKSFGEAPEATYGLALVERVRGNIDKAEEHMKRYVNFSPDIEKTAELAKMYENFGRYDEARKIYYNLREKYPENGYYRKKFVETTAFCESNTGKNELSLLLAQIHRDVISNESVWPLYETAIGQKLASKKGDLTSEWLKRAMLTWRKAEEHPDFNSWCLWEMIRSKLDNSQGIEKTKLANSFKKILEKNLREMPDYYGSYLAMARCLLAFNDLTNNDKALDYLKRAWFLNDSLLEIGELFAKTAKSVGQSIIVDVVGYNVVLSEPEVANSVFKFQ